MKRKNISAGFPYLQVDSPINVLEKQDIYSTKHSNKVFSFQIFNWIFIATSKTTLSLWLDSYLRHPFSFVFLSHANKLKWECQQFRSRKVLPGDSINPPNGGPRSYVGALIWKETCSLSRVQSKLSVVHGVSSWNLLEDFISALDYFRSGWQC